MITLALLMLASDVPQQPQTMETAALKLAIARAEKAFQQARADAAEANLEAVRIASEAQARMQSAREAYSKLIRELKGWREGCVTDDAQNLKCPPEPAKPTEKKK